MSLTLDKLHFIRNVMLSSTPSAWDDTGQGISRFLKRIDAEEAYSLLADDRATGYFPVLNRLNRAIAMHQPPMPDDALALEETLRTLLAHEKHHEKRLDEIRAKKRELEQRLQDLLNRR